MNNYDQNAWKEITEWEDQSLKIDYVDPLPQMKLLYKNYVKYYHDAIA